jgi:acyl carrier protein
MTEQELLDFVAEFAHIDRNQLTLATELNVIDIDSLAKMELVFQLEDRYKITIPSDDIAVSTLQEVLDLVNRHLP